MGGGGIVGSFSIGHIIDWARHKERIIVWIALLLGLTFAVLPLVARMGLVPIAVFFAWGLLGWASQAPQQYTLLRLHRGHGAAAVALNSSANYLGAASGAVAGGLFLDHLSVPSFLPFAAAACAMLALILRLGFGAALHNERSHPEGAHQGRF